jgi:hypothetical protein
MGNNIFLRSSQLFPAHKNTSGHEKYWRNVTPRKKNLKNEDKEDAILWFLDNIHDSKNVDLHNRFIPLRSWNTHGKLQTKWTQLLLCGQVGLVPARPTILTSPYLPDRLSLIFNGYWGLHRRGAEQKSHQADRTLQFGAEVRNTWIYTHCSLRLSVVVLNQFGTWTILSCICVQSARFNASSLRP